MDNNERCYDCGCCNPVDGWCDLIGAYGFDVEKCTVSDEDKWQQSMWNIHAKERNV